MAAIPYALSVHHFISTVGADAGFAAIIGLALLVLLFFIHARETANLRRRADEAEDELHRLEAYVDQIARSGAAGQPAQPQPTPAPAVAAASNANATRTATPVPAAVPAPVPVGLVAASPGAPAGVGAPALNAATRLIPVGGDDAISIRANRSATVVERVRAATAVADPPPPPPSTSAGHTNGSTVPRVAPPPAVGPAPSSRGRLPLRPQGRPAASSPSRRRSGRVGRGAIIVVTALVVVIAAGVAVVLTNNSSGGNSGHRATGAQRASHAANTTAKSSGRTGKRTALAVTPNTVTVAVLNGTSTTNLAHDISSKLTAAGFKQGTIATATDQTQSSTIVGYLPNDRRDALAVARSLKLSPAAVQAVDQNNRTVACNGATTSCPAQVVVTVGSDLASNA